MKNVTLEKGMITCKQFTAFDYVSACYFILTFDLNKTFDCIAPIHFDVFLYETKVKLIFLVDITISNINLVYSQKKIPRITDERC